MAKRKSKKKESVRSADTPEPEPSTKTTPPEKNCIDCIFVRLDQDLAVHFCTRHQETLDSLLKKGILKTGKIFCIKFVTKPLSRPRK